MKSKIILLIVTVVILLACVVGIVVLTRPEAETEGGDAGEETTAAAETEQLSRLLYEKAPDTVANIHVMNETGEYDVKKFADNAWFIEEFYGHVHSVGQITAVVECAAKMTSQQVVDENAEDMSVYGLGTPRAVVDISFENGEVKHLNIGSDAPAKSLAYISYEDEKTVYAVNKADISVFLQDKFSFIQRTVYNVHEDDGSGVDPNKVNSITISRKDIDYDIVLEYDDRQDDDSIVSGNSSTHVMTSPVRMDLNPDHAYNVINGVFGLTASKVAVLSPSEEVMAEYGLADPQCVVDFDIVGGSFRLMIGSRYNNPDLGEKGYYCYAEGFDVIYIFGDDALPWLTVKPLDIAMTLITSNYIYDIETLSIKTQTRDCTFELSGDVNTFEVALNGDTVNAEKFKSFYQYFLKAPADDIYLGNLEGKEPLVSVVINNRNGTVTDVKFVQVEDRVCAIIVNGVPNYKCRTAYVTRLADNLDSLLNGGNIIDTW